MKFLPEKYSIEDKRMEPFISPDEIWNYINNTKSSKERVREVISKSLEKKRLTLEETAVLLNATQPEQIEEIKQAARKLKNNVYGNRIVLFAPLYIGNLCSNDCTYCGFRTTNKESVRKTLSTDEIITEVKSLEDDGQKRLILVYGEHPKYTPEFIADSVRTVYGVKSKNGEIRRVNINAAPLSIDGFKTVKDSGIGTYQVFQETYNPQAYSIYHKSGNKKDFNNRLTSLDRAMEAGLDDVGIGALFGLYDWRYEVLGLVRHTNHLEACYNVGPHTISFPRIQDTSCFTVNNQYSVSDEDFVKLVAILRLAVPYTGMILTARESHEIRREVLKFGVSQIDGGTKIEIGSYSEKNGYPQDLKREQFCINDNRSLNDIINELVEDNFLPSFCTACYRLGRTGEHFMEFSVPGFIKEKCSPNAILTFAEYLEDYAKGDSYINGWKTIEKNILAIENSELKENVINKVAKIKNKQRDLYY
ncbi:MAG: [FeFe] hydrogenase H-cluster radical SAM maturase HydG [Bacteroidetes bacterium GWA2_30_7]|nr:MAG: [FeFe] hydrogenase H-cluster radical SAM maturase HydG [Bacteroidetes bacterium GWA2_30_7]